MIPIFLGPKAKKAMELDTGTAGAAGASLLGAALIGPVGLAGGFLVRGNDKQIKEGTIAYVETSEPKNVKGFRILNGRKYFSTTISATNRAMINSFFHNSCL